MPVAVDLGDHVETDVGLAMKHRAQHREKGGAVDETQGLDDHGVVDVWATKLITLSSSDWLSIEPSPARRSWQPGGQARALFRGDLTEPVDHAGEADALEVEALHPEDGADLVSLWWRR